MKPAIERLAIGGVLLFTFTVTFLLTTVFFDSIEHAIGYYDEGISDSKALQF